eukprot:61508_1
MALRKLRKKYWRQIGNLNLPFIGRKTSNKNSRENMINMKSLDHLYDSLLIIHTHSFPISNDTLSAIVPAHYFDRFVLYEELSLDVRTTIKNAMVLSKNTDINTMRNAKDTLLNHIQLTNNRKGREINFIALFWFKHSGCRMPLDTNIIALIIRCSGCLHITERTTPYHQLFVLLDLYVGAIKAPVKT